MAIFDTIKIKPMNKIIVFVLACIMNTMVFAQQDPVIMTIDGNPITKSEFLQIYLKNNDNPQYDKASLDEYMELFKRFKLKVAEAEALGYDTIPKLVKELAGYQKQLARPYLIDSSKNEFLVREAYEHTKSEVRAAHILIKLESNAPPEDTLKAYNRLMALKKRIEGGEDFGALAKGRGGSDDPTAQTNGGDLGYFTAFQMVYQFEDAAFATPVGGVSNPFRTRFGYHILKVADKRPARGTIEAAHVMIAVTRKATSVDVEDAQAKIDEIYSLLEAGGDFEELVKKHTDDPSSKDKGGLLPKFGTGTTTRMVPEFSQAAFELKNNGDFSKPIRTDYGFHIIKRIGWEDVPAFEILEKDLEKKVAKDARAVKTQASFVTKLKKQYGFKSKSKKGLKWFNQNIDSTYHFGKFRADQLKGNKVLFKLDKQKFRAQPFAVYMEENFRGARKEDPKTVVEKQYKLWENEAILGYEETKLAAKYPAYKALITEYHDGILLYEVMSDKVWNLAMQDTVGLKEFHGKNESSYRWGNRLDADIFECSSRANADTLIKLLAVDTLSTQTVVRLVNASSPLNVKHKRGKYDVAKTVSLSGSPNELKEGLNATYEVDGKFYVVRVIEKIPAGLKEFDEAKGAITSDYQNFLEIKWLSEIETKHKVIINSEALYSIGK
jgi:peptidyl-prolyl cis-trans isomerase SurA